MEQRDLGPRHGGPDHPENAFLAEAEQVSNAAAGDGPAQGRPSSRHRWIAATVVGVVAVTLASTAAALASRPSPTRQDGAAQSTISVTTDAATTNGTTNAAAGVTTGESTSAAPTTATVTIPSPSPLVTTTKSPAPTTSSPKPSATTTSSSATDANSETSCEDQTHDTPADEAVMFTGMTKGTQAAFLAAQAGAKQAGLQFILNSGYRTPAYQLRIYDCWVKQLGSPEAARKYALPPSESAHVQGYAMDIAPPSAAAWLQASAGKYGLCRRYTDEPWHFEYQTYYKTKGCPALLPRP